MGKTGRKEEKRGRVRFHLNISSTSKYPLSMKQNLHSLPKTLPCPPHLPQMRLIQAKHWVPIL